MNVVPSRNRFTPFSLVRHPLLLGIFVTSGPLFRSPNSLSDSIQSISISSSTLTACSSGMSFSIKVVFLSLFLEIYFCFLACPYCITQQFLFYPLNRITPYNFSSFLTHLFFTFICSNLVPCRSCAEETSGFFTFQDGGTLSSSSLSSSSVTFTGLIPLTSA